MMLAELADVPNLWFPPSLLGGRFPSSLLRNRLNKDVTVLTLVIAPVTLCMLVVDDEAFRFLEPAEKWIPLALSS